MYRCAILTVVLSVAIVSTARAVASDNKEGLVKAAFIYNFVKFVEWPGDKAISKQSNINICTVGDDGVSQAGSVFSAASTPSLKLTLRPLDNWRSAAGDCHILFISRLEDAQINSIIANLKSLPVLTVSDSRNFVERGGMIGFVVSDNKVKIAVNMKAATAAGLRVDAQLLEIALKVIN